MQKGKEGREEGKERGGGVQEREEGKERERRKAEEKGEEGREEGEERMKSNVNCQNLCSQAINWPQ